MEKINEKNRSLIYLAVYWAILVIVPFVLILFTRNKQYSFDWTGYLMFYIIFIAPVLFVLPYKFSNIKNIKNKILYILFGLVVPYLFIYLLIYMHIKQTFRPGF